MLKLTALAGAALSVAVAAPAAATVVTHSAPDRGWDVPFAVACDMPGRNPVFWLSEGESSMRHCADVAAVIVPPQTIVNCQDRGFANYTDSTSRFVIRGNPTLTCRVKRVGF